jgi:hypothetical protein
VTSGDFRGANESMVEEAVAAPAHSEFVDLEVTIPRQLLDQIAHEADRQGVSMSRAVQLLLEHVLQEGQHLGSLSYSCDCGRRIHVATSTKISVAIGAVTTPQLDNQEAALDSQVGPMIKGS